MVGHGRQRLLLGPRYRGTETEQNRSVRSFPKDKLPEHPTRVHSLTFVDLEGSRVSRRIGCALAKEARRAPSLQRIDVRVAGDPFENDVIGDLIFVLENLDLETTAAADIAPVSRPHIVVNAALSHVPELGWAEELGVRQRATVLWDHSTEALYVGSPLSNAIAVAA